MIGIAEVTISSDFAIACARELKPEIEQDLNTLRDILVEEFNEPKSGRVYRRPSGGDYRASAPGQPPAIRTGDLRDSITEPEVREEGGTIVGEIRITAPYAEELEYGGRNAPRPFVIPAIDKLIKGLNAIGAR